MIRLVLLWSLLATGKASLVEDRNGGTSKVVEPDQKRRELWHPRPSPASTRYNLPFPSVLQPTKDLVPTIYGSDPTSAPTSIQLAPEPTALPTLAPITSEPTTSPIAADSPSLVPTEAPVEESEAPSILPTIQLTMGDTPSPTFSPSAQEPVEGESDAPSNVPSIFSIESDAPSDVPSSVSIESDTPSNVPSSVPSPPLNPECAADVFQSDSDDDGFISQEEFLLLINIIGARDCYSQTDPLTVPQLSAYFTLSCEYGPSCLISSEIPIANLTSEELIDVCQTTSELIDSTCAPDGPLSGTIQPSPTPVPSLRGTNSPTVSPSSEAPSILPTIQVTSIEPLIASSTSPSEAPNESSVISVQGWQLNNAWNDPVHWGYRRRKNDGRNGP